MKPRNEVPQRTAQKYPPVGDLDDLYLFWNNVYDWSRYQGDEWSARWGGADMQWYWSIYPRIRQHLPAATILEIGAGQGRWSERLRPHCDLLIVSDISERCIHACKQRLGSEGVLYRVSNGRELNGVDDASVDFCFSFESLVLAERDVLHDYLKELRRVLRPEGTAFWHHSNIGEYPLYFRLKDWVPKKLRRPLKRLGMLDYDEMRAKSVTAAWLEQQATAEGLSVLSQELVPWGGKRLIDCFSVLKNGPAERANQILENPGFIKRAYEIQRLSRLYGEGVPW
jgi:ubiquinone/menaquinone biosynthesis C-methylase UbiE